MNIVRTSQGLNPLALFQAQRAVGSLWEWHAVSALLLTGWLGGAISAMRPSRRPLRLRRASAVELRPTLTPVQVPKRQVARDGRGAVALATVRAKGALSRLERVATPPSAAASLDQIAAQVSLAADLLHATFLV